jgi:hypothetical protein
MGPLWVLNQKGLSGWGGIIFWAMGETGPAVRAGDYYDQI